MFPKGSDAEAEWARHIRGNENSESRLRQAQGLPPAKAQPNSYSVEKGACSDVERRTSARAGVGDR